MPQESTELEAIKKKLAVIDRKLDQLLKLQTRLAYRGSFVPDTIASLPEHLRKTALTIATMGQATARQIAIKTGRTRAAESDYLNQLASRGFLKKERKGREVRFLVFALYTQCAQCSARVPMTLDHCPVCGTSLSARASRNRTDKSRAL